MEVRLKKVERVNKLLLVAVLLLSLPWILGAAKDLMEVSALKAGNIKAGTIGANTLLLVTEDGKTRGAVDVTKGGAGKVCLFDSNDKQRILLGVMRRDGKEIPAVIFYGEDGEVIGGLVEDKGKPRLFSKGE